MCAIPLWRLMELYLLCCDGLQILFVCLGGHAFDNVLSAEGKYASCMLTYPCPSAEKSSALGT